MNYWGKERLYHHTPPISLIYALREAMRIVLEEGLEARWERHRQNQLALMGGIEDTKFRNQLLDEFNIEIAGGIGALKGKIWRIGLMGYSSQKPHVLLLLAAAEKVLLEQGYRVPAGAGVAAAIRT